jgi:hemolysin D
MKRVAQRSPGRQLGRIKPVRRSRWLALWPEPRRAVMADAIAFLDPIDQICEERPPRFLRSVHLLVVGLFASLLTLSALVEVEIVVVGSGRLATDTPPVVVQPMDRSIIRELNVRPGDAVTRGQVLATLDPTFAQADLKLLASRRQALAAQVARLEAEANTRPFEAAQPASADNELQSTLFRQRQGQLGSRLRGFDQDIERLQSILASTEANGTALLKQVEVARSVEMMRTALMQNQTGSRLQYLESMSARLRIERDQQEIANRVPELQHGLQARQAERQGFLDEWGRQLSEALIAARAEEASVTEALVKASRLNDLVVVRAPSDGVVLDVARRSEGSVLREAEALMTIIPGNATMIAEVMISSADVGYTAPGAEVQIKVEAFPYQRHGMLRGRLLSVSEESFGSTGGAGVDAPPSSGGAGGSFHRGRVELLGTTLEKMPERARVFPGMTLTAEINAGTRTVLSYFLYPLTRGLRESIREP